MSRKNARHIMTLARRRYDRQRPQRPVIKPSMADLLRRYAKLTGSKAQEVANGFECEMPSGCILTVWDKSVKYVEGLYAQIVFGEIYYPERKFCKIRYIGQREANVLYKELADHIAKSRSKIK